LQLGARISFNTQQAVAVEKRSGSAAGIDKGYSSLVTISRGDPEDAIEYGAGVGPRMSALVARADDRRKQRRRIAAYERSIRNEDPNRARHLRRRNLSRRRESARVKRYRSTAEGLMNGALNELFDGLGDVATVFAESLTFATSSRRGRAFNRAMGRWSKGLLHRRLAFKAELNGVEFKVVNAAYTSQTCPACWFTSARNRVADRFECGDCGYTGRADAVAATNVLRRGSDPAITRYMAPVAVRQILLERWRSARNGRARDSNEEARATDVALEPRLGTSREQPLYNGPSLRGSNSPHEDEAAKLEPPEGS
jgi:IS605 OrfB family transposase